MTAFEAQRHEICRVGRSLFERGHVHASAGNISVRLPGGQGFLITPTDACLGFLQPDQLAHAPFDDDTRDSQATQATQDSQDSQDTRNTRSAQDTHAQPATPRASKTLSLHRAIYAAEPQAHCVIHTHSTHLVALTLSGVWRADCILPPITPYFVMKVGRVPLIPYHRPGDPAVAAAVVALIESARAPGTPIRAVLLDRLGPNVWHESPGAAMATLEELEETARLWLMGGRQVTPLSAAQLDELHSAFGARW